MTEIKRLIGFLLGSLAAGMLILLPIYLSVLLLLRAMQAVGGLVHPLAQLLPERLPAEQALSLLMVLLACLLTGVGVHTAVGRAARNRIEASFLEKIPGYSLFRSLTRQVAGRPEEQAWKPALAVCFDVVLPLARRLSLLQSGSGTGSVDVYENRGQYQFLIRKLEPRGAGN
jgi:uncharacterized membrane protein